MPACGTVTTSPASRTILFLVSPFSINSPRLIVMVLVRGGGSAGAAGVLAPATAPVDAGKALFCALEIEGAEVASGFPFGGVAPAGTVEEFGSSGPIEGGSVVSV